MSYPAGTVRVTFGGALPSGETWNTGFSVMGATGTWTEAQLGTYLESIRGRVDTAVTAISQLWYPGTTYGGFIKGYLYDGGDNAVQVAIAAGGSNVAGSMSGNGSPIDTCAVATLVTGSPSRSGRGRMYWPYQAQVPATGHLTSAQCEAIAGPTAAMLTGVNADGGGPKAAVASRTHAVNRLISQVRCDDIPDVQRRRQNKLRPVVIVTEDVD